MTTSCSYVQIFIATPDGSGGYSIPKEPLAWSSPGATLGVKFDGAGNLYIANAPLGLLQVSQHHSTYPHRWQNPPAGSCSEFGMLQTPIADWWHQLSGALGSELVSRLMSSPAAMQSPAHVEAARAQEVLQFCQHTA
jgi:hypothetical protein